VLINIPKTASRTADQAIAWQHEMAEQLPNLVNKQASLLEQAVQAVQIKNDILVAARNAMDDANLAAQLGMIQPPRTFAEMLRARSDEYAGDALYRQIISDAQSELKGVQVLDNALYQDQFCFAAGTLVHTKEGLKPIEQIQVGDWVLSRSENGEGEQAYKRVTRTIKHENKAVCRVRIKRRVGKDLDIIVTGNHPFFVAGHHRDEEEWPDQEEWDALPKNTGWLRADWLDADRDKVLLADGQMARVSEVAPIWRTRQEGVGWVALSRESEVGYLIDLRDGKISDSFDGPVHIDTVYYDKGVHYTETVYTDVEGAESFGCRDESPEAADPWAYKCDVYNIEVEDFHTYYVGEEGVWVHNTNCFEPV
jgi:hypothetical protein